MRRKRMVLNLVLAALLAAVTLGLPHEATATDWCSGGVCQEWVARYEANGSPRAIAVDQVGNVYVTGYSTGDGTNYDYATTKYDSDGNELWVARYEGGANYRDEAHGIAVDASGNAYVTGFSYGSSTGYDYATIKYRPDGSEQWTARYNGRGGGDRALALALDTAGNVYVTGYSNSSEEPEGNYDYATIKYDSDGNELWVARYDGPAGDDDFAYALAVDGLGNVYVTGGSPSSDTNYDYATIKYDSGGNQQWVARYDGPAGSMDDFAIRVLVDGSGSVYVLGASEGAGTDRDFMTIKYAPDGSEQWVARYNGPASGYDEPQALAMDASGNAYVAGSSRGSDTNGDYATIKYAPDGSVQWVARYDGNDWDDAHALTVDSSGNAFVTGSSHASDTAPDYTTIKYDSNGNQVWLASYDGPASGADVARALVLDGAGNVYVTGSSTGDGTGWDYATIKYVQTVPTPTPHPTPSGVGGAVNLPPAAIAAEASRAADGPGSSTANGIVWAGAMAGVILLLATGGWYARRRYGR